MLVEQEITMITVIHIVGYTCIGYSTAGSRLKITFHDTPVILTDQPRALPKTIQKTQ